jgi:hypothetical protein
MASITDSGRMDKGKNWPNLMPNVRMAIGAFDLVVRHMIFMHELRGKFCAQYFRFIMALDTFSLRDMTIALNDIDMALLTSYPSCNIFPMIEAPTLDLNIPFWLNVAGGASSNSTGNAFFLPTWASLKIVTDETVYLMNGKVSALNELGMTGGATKSHPSSQLFHVCPV